MGRQSTGRLPVRREHFSAVAIRHPRGLWQREAHAGEFSEACRATLANR